MAETPEKIVKDKKPKEKAEAGSGAKLSPNSTIKNSGPQEAILKKQYRIELDQPAETYSHAYADAFEATHVTTGEQGFIAVIPKDRFPLRFNDLNTLSNSEVIGLLPPIAHGPVRWPNQNGLRYVILYPKTSLTSFTRTFTKDEKIPEEDLLRKILPSLCETIQELSDKGVYHGNINPDTIFFNPTNPVQTMLGDFCSSLPGLLQSALFESTERAMTDPEGRGVGDAQDDIYALGVSTALMLHGKNPFTTWTRDEILDERLGTSSYAMLTKGVRINPGVAEFLRGTLEDSPKQRWTIDQLTSWASGSRATSRSKATVRKAARALVFNGKKFFTPRPLAAELHKNPTELVEMIEKGELSKWIERSLSNSELASRIDAVMARIGGREESAGFMQKLCTEVAMILDPTAPIRHLGKAVMPMGIGGALHFALATNQDPKPYINIIKYKYAWAWLGNEANVTLGTPDVLHKFDSCSKIIQRKGLTQGVERVLYTLIDNAPCLSPNFANSYAITPRHIAHSINLIDERDTIDLVDKHIANFILNYENKDQSGVIKYISDSDEIMRNLAILTLYHGIVSRHAQGTTLKNLTKRLAPMTKKVAQRFKNKNKMDDVIKKIDTAADHGDINELMDLVDNPKTLRDDDISFARAKQAFEKLTRERLDLEKGLAQASYGLASGREIAAVVSSGLAAIFTLLVVIMKFG